ncbi:MAG TPA: TIGR01777 family oxidoreductase [Blastocatellia bacterium]|nr:TIGR01777 family oxidoreductase [Blastocatellia bacterium]
MKILVTGATGLIGRSLCASLAAEGHSVTGLSRSPERAAGVAARMLEWNPMVGPPPEESLSNLDAIVHLAGEPIAARRWTAEQKKRIRDSRILSTKNLVDGLRAAQSKPEVLVGGSAVGFYGERGDEELDESSAQGSGFMSELCAEWEQEAARARSLGIRVVHLRTGVVLSRDGGALKKMLTPFKLGLGGKLASGRQWFPWIHIEDIIGIIRFAIASAALSGPVNGAAPEPVTNAEFTRELARALHRPAFFTVPEFALRLALGEMADALLMSQRVLPKAALAAGYQFRFPRLGAALDDLFAEKEATTRGAS